MGWLLAVVAHGPGHYTTGLMEPEGGGARGEARRRLFDAQRLFVHITPRCLGLGLSFIESGC